MGIWGQAEVTALYRLPNQVNRSGIIIIILCTAINASIQSSVQQKRGSNGKSNYAGTYDGGAAF